MNRQIWRYALWHANKRAQRSAAAERAHGECALGRWNYLTRFTLCSRQPGGSHLPEEMKVVAAHGQDVVAPLEVDVRRFVLPPRHVADRTQIHDD